MLVLGAQIGLFFDFGCQFLFPRLQIQPVAFAVVGWPPFSQQSCGHHFGIVLVTEMTGDVTMLLPMLGACFQQCFSPRFFGIHPFTDSLKERSLRNDFQLRLFRHRGR